MILPPAERKVVKIPHGHIHPDAEQPRKEFDWDKLKELAASIRTNGQWVPIILRPHPELPGHGVLVDGERRWRAMALVPRDTLDAVIVDGPLDAGQLLMVQMSLGVTNQKLDPLEVGEGCQKLMRLFGLSPAELAERIGTSEGTVSKLLRVLNGLAEGLRGDVKSGALPLTVAYHIARLKDVPQQVEIAEDFKAGRLKWDSIATEVSRRLNKGKPRSKVKPVAARTPRGLSAVLPPLDYDGVLAELGTVVEAVKKAQRHDLPLSSVPQLLRNT